MTFVIDASIAMSWCFPDENNDLADKALSNLIYEGAIVPSIWWYEIRNVLLIGERRNRIVKNDSEAFLKHVNRLPIEIDQSHSNDLTLEIARNHDLTVYDAAYVELADRVGCKLATLDRLLNQAAENLKIELF
ncbi:MAG: type II toxin-antitoxin system VapC family toxin [Balneola sp.]